MLSISNSIFFAALRTAASCFSYGNNLRFCYRSIYSTHLIESGRYGIGDHLRFKVCRLLCYGCVHHFLWRSKFPRLTADIFLMYRGSWGGEFHRLVPSPSSLLLQLLMNHDDSSYATARNCHLRLIDETLVKNHFAFEQSCFLSDGQESHVILSPVSS